MQFAMRRIAWFTGLTALTLLLLCCRMVRVSGGSMEDTLYSGDRVLIVRTDIAPFGIVTRWIRHGSIVVAKDPTRAGRWIVKRVAALGGDRLRIANGRVLIDGTEVLEAEGVATSGNRWPAPPGTSELIVPDDHYFLLGDNRGGAVDSRSYGPVRRETVVGLVVGVLKAAKGRDATSDSVR